MQQQQSFLSKESGGRIGGGATPILPGRTGSSSPW